MESGTELVHLAATATEGLPPLSPPAAPRRLRIRQCPDQAVHLHTGKPGDHLQVPGVEPGPATNDAAVNLNSFEFECHHRFPATGHITF